VTYREDGLWKETVRTGPSGALRALLQALNAGEGSPPERVADYVVANDVARHGPGRLHYPVALPGGPGGAWARGLASLRRGLHERKLPSEPGWLIADGFDGRARVHAATQDEAWDAWHEEVARVKPRPPGGHAASAAPPQEPWAESLAESFPPPQDRTQDPVWPEPTLENLAAACVRLEACPLPAHAWAPWMRALGPHGESVYGLQRFRPDGFTVVGQDVFERVDLERLEDLLDAADAQIPPTRRRTRRRWPSRTRTRGTTSATSSCRAAWRSWATSSW
jgi:hypothetical protein